MITSVQKTPYPNQIKKAILLYDMFRKKQCTLMYSRQVTICKCSKSKIITSVQKPHSPNRVGKLFILVCVPKECTLMYSK